MSRMRKDGWSMREPSSSHIIHISAHGLHHNTSDSNIAEPTGRVEGLCADDLGDIAVRAIEVGGPC